MHLQCPAQTSAAGGFIKVLLTTLIWLIVRKVCDRLIILCPCGDSPLHFPHGVFFWISPTPIIWHIVSNAYDRLFILCSFGVSPPNIPLPGGGRFLSFPKYMWIPLERLNHFMHLRCLVWNFASSVRTFQNFADTLHVTYRGKACDCLIIFCTSHYPPSPHTLLNIDITHYMTFRWKGYDSLIILYTFVAPLLTLSLGGHFSEFS